MFKEKKRGEYSRVINVNVSFSLIIFQKCQPSRYIPIIPHRLVVLPTHSSLGSAMYLPLVCTAPESADAVKLKSRHPGCDLDHLSHMVKPFLLTKWRLPTHSYWEDSNVRNRLCLAQAQPVCMVLDFYLTPKPKWLTLSTLSSSSLPQNVPILCHWANVAWGKACYDHAPQGLISLWGLVPGTKRRVIWGWEARLGVSCGEAMHLQVSPPLVCSHVW